METPSSQLQLQKGSQRLFTLLWFLWVIGLLAIASSSVQEKISATLSDPVFFKTREALHKTPALSPRLKVFALDDGTTNFLGGPNLSTKDFALLIENIARRKPKAILLDRLFGSQPTDEDAMKFIADLRALDIPVYSGATIKSSPVKTRENLLPDEKYGMKRWLEGDNSSNMSYIQHSLHNMNEGLVYSYDPSYEGVFHGVGHISFRSIGLVDPVLVYKDKIIPHLALYAADSYSIKDEQLIINNKAVPLTDKGSAIVNHRPLASFYAPEIMKPLKNAMKRARLGQKEDWVKEGDVVFILFNFYTGSTDFLEGAPFGDLPGGLFVSMLADSILENHWITPTSNFMSLMLILIMNILGVGLARASGPLVFWLMTFVAGIVYFLSSMYLFSYQNVMLPWILPLCGLLGGGTIQYVKQRLGSELRAVEMENQYLIERALRLEEEKTNLQLAERLNLGRAIQQILLPPLGVQKHGPFIFDMSYIPAQEMSGDWVYIWGKDGSAQKRVIIGDVVGKGPSAAIPVAILIGILGECEKVDMPMEETLHYLNRRVLELFGKQVTCSCSVIIIGSAMEIDLYNAGSPGWFYRGEGKARHISMRSSTLGMAEEAYFAHEKLVLTPGSFLFAFTDGYMEGARAFRRLITRLGTVEEAPSFRELQGMLDEVGRPFRLEDDRSLLMIKAQTDEETKTDSEVA